MRIKWNLSLPITLLACLPLASTARGQLLSPLSVRDQGGSIYSVVTTNDAFPAVPGAYQPNFVKVLCSPGAGNPYCPQPYVIKFSPDGTRIDWWTFLGGSGLNTVTAIALDSHGNVWVTGRTESTDMPLTSGAIQAAPAAGFLDALSPDGHSLVYGSYIGTGNEPPGTLLVEDSPWSLLIDEHDSIYITGLTHSPSFVTTPGVYRSATAPAAAELFAMKLDSAGSKITYSTLLGPVETFCFPSLCTPSGTWYNYQTIVDAQGDLYISGGTSRADFPVTQGAYSHPGKNLDVVVVALNPTGTGVLFSTVIGGQGNDSVGGFARDSAGNLYVAGRAGDGPFPNPGQPPPSYDFPVTKNAMQTAYGPGFLLELSGDGSSLVYSTFLGTVSSTAGADNLLPWLQPLGIQFGPDGNLRMLTYSDHSDLALTPDSLDPCYPIAAVGYGPAHWAYARFSPDLESIEYATAVPEPEVRQPFFVDPADKLYIASLTNYFDILDLSKPVPPGPTCMAATIRQEATTIAPGLLVSIFGPQIGPPQPVYGAPDSNGTIGSVLSGTQVLFDNLPAPIMYASPSRIDTVVPFGVPTFGNTTVSVLKNGVSLGTLTNAIAPTSITLFSVDKTGYGSAAWNQDGTPNTPTNPASPGDVLTAYATGMGVMTPTVPDGLVPSLPTASVAVPLNPEFTFKALYVGDAPGEIEGVVQINFQLEPNARSGVETFRFYPSEANLGDQNYYYVYVK